ncbi:ribonuclease inhibitor-like [Periophthalmus magnuspinnatus]|uniref:ribonuclease inhibitor-like n=1 Tax=Periophthalmus magnuspinnatus TaxID=409849 RepID=UPI002436B2FD|nr:ribonuclease inhibitor-like [Periophthalmus magnuspinnatus]
MVSPPALQLLLVGPSTLLSSLTLKKIPIEQTRHSDFEFEEQERREIDFYHSAAELAESSPNGHLDLFLRFLLGLSLPVNPSLLLGLLEEFDLRKYDTSEEAFLGLLPVLRASPKVILSNCSCYGPLALVLNFSCLTHLDLSNNFLGDSEVEQLCSELKSASCRLEVLSLSCCELSARCCGALASVLSSSCLTHLDVSNNDFEDSGVEQLCSGLKSAACRLEVLRLSGCLISERGGAALASALSSAHSHLRELDLSYNHPGPSAELLTTLRDHCPLDSLRLDPAGECWMVPGLKKHFCEVSLDPNTANNTLELSVDKRTVTSVDELQLYLSHQDRFSSCAQVLSSTGLTGRCYWEVEWRGNVDIAVSYKGIRRRGDAEDCRFGDNEQSWSLR